MITLMDFFKTVTPLVCGGTKYLWDCYGNNARFLDLGESEEEMVCSIIYDTQTKRIYEINLYNTNGGIDVHEWIDPEFKALNEQERKNKKIKNQDDWVVKSTNDLEQLMVKIEETLSSV